MRLPLKSLKETTLNIITTYYSLLSVILYFTVESDRECKKIFNDIAAENYKILMQKMRSMRRNIPPMISSYMRLSPSMQCFDSYVNDDLGGVAEMAIMLDKEEFYDDIKRRYNVS